MRITSLHTRWANNYIIELEDKTILVDCSCELKDLKNLLPKLDAIVITHGHFDHFITLKEVQKFYGCNVYLHPKAYEKLSNSKMNASDYFNMQIACNLGSSCVQFLKEGIASIEGVPALIYYAYGHTNDSILIKINNALFVGDFVFKNSFGRTDLPTGDYRLMQKNLEKYKELINDNIVFYGH